MIEQQIVVLLAATAGVLIGSVVGMLIAVSCFMERLEFNKVVELMAICFRNDGND